MSISISVRYAVQFLNVWYMVRNVAFIDQFNEMRFLTHGRAECLPAGYHCREAAKSSGLPASCYKHTNLAYLMTCQMPPAGPSRMILAFYHLKHYFLCVLHSQSNVVWPILSSLTKTNLWWWLLLSSNIRLFSLRSLAPQSFPPWCRSISHPSGCTSIPLSWWWR